MRRTIGEMYGAESRKLEKVFRALKRSAVSTVLAGENSKTMVLTLRQNRGIGR